MVTNIKLTQCLALGRLLLLVRYAKGSRPPTITGNLRMMKARS